ncbi:hypothetical protein [Pelagovum pacificum]|uniref:Sialate O-acetylesterase domain-containing protein n=1 Tax=Pelagovum pacificum TaxID=2588711 RepID=A0A5C5GG33_9RHOB|nr:hypothetical protein [Pelagovum pacificum]QQA43961.1 hypothetical protein I8N54_05115 [Pelagovum pacificum]TNY32911.1 hypothetical protein FHY64_06440 [Pelagovum pacificum]
MAEVTTTISLLPATAQIHEDGYSGIMQAWAAALPNHSAEINAVSAEINVVAAEINVQAQAALAAGRWYEDVDTGMSETSSGETFSTTNKAGEFELYLNNDDDDLLLGTFPTQTALLATQSAVETAQVAAETARDLAETYAGAVDRATSVAGLVDPSTVANGAHAIVSGSGDPDIDGLYEEQSDTWVRIGDTGLASKLAQAAFNRFSAGYGDFQGAGDTVPIVATTRGDGTGLAILFGFNRVLGRLVGEGIPDEPVQDTIDSSFPGHALYNGEGPIIPIVGNSDSGIILGYDLSTDKLVGAGLAASSSSPQRERRDKTVPTADMLQAMVYGQSWSLGTGSDGPLTTVQPYNNITFSSGPVTGSSGTTSKALVEGANESPCSIIANMAYSYGLSLGAFGDEQVFFASSAGQGSREIDELDADSTRWELVQDQLTDAGTIAANAGDTHKIAAMCWIQGQADIASPVTPQETYYGLFTAMADDFAAEATGQTGQTESPVILYTQTARLTSSRDQVALAQLQADGYGDIMYLVTPEYFLPFSDDDLHPTEVGHRWYGAYLGRALAEVLAGYEPQRLKPLGAITHGAEVHIRFKVPRGPLVFDTSNMEPMTNHGFQVKDDGSTVSIASLRIRDDKVVIRLADAPTGPVTVSYALSESQSWVGAEQVSGGNLRDSSADTVLISGVRRPLFNWSPHFAFTAPISEE